VLYEMEELVGQLESLVSMMERICTIMEVSLKERRQEGRTIRYAIAKFAESGSLKRAALREGRERYERLKGQVSELDTRLAVALVELKTSSGTVNVGAPLGDDVVQACAELGRLAAERQQRAAELRSVREGAQQLMGQIRDTERQIATMRQRLEAVIGASARCGADQQTRIESLEQQRAQVEARLCGLVAELG
jgi:chromosome segregation ATPase